MQNQIDALQTSFGRNVTRGRNDGVKELKTIIIPVREEVMIRRQGDSQSTLRPLVSNGDVGRCLNRRDWRKSFKT